MTSHTLKAFDEDLDQLRSAVSDMGRLAASAVGEALRALEKGDADLAARVVEGDRRIDALEVEVERRAVELIALRAPMADDLREVIAALKISGMVERIGDYAKNIARRVNVIDRSGTVRPLSMLPEMAQIAGEMVRDALEAFADRDVAKAVTVCERDQAVDDFYSSIFHALLTYMMEDPANITTAAHLQFVARNLERIGDHATNIAEMVYYAASGEHIAERTRGADPAEIGPGRVG